MLSPEESAALVGLRSARDTLSAEGAYAAVDAVEAAMREVYAIGGERDQANVEQADYLAGRVAVLSGAVERLDARTVEATVKKAKDGKQTVTVTVEPPPPEPEPGPALEPAAAEPLTP